MCVCLKYKYLIYVSIHANSKTRVMTYGALYTINSNIDKAKAKLFVNFSSYYNSPRPYGKLAAKPR
ncbi:hypothetical protein OAG1_26690 [Agarivorans sp. OAG1]|nr:hypothetical protein OAG1_26690 [Agarivorans sp. OAG1]